MPLPSETSMADGPVVDSQALDRLREWGGDKLLAQMIRLFLDNSGNRMDQIRSGVENSDPEEAERGSHSLKSSAANVGVMAVRAIAAEMEGLATKGDIDSVRSMLPGLETAYAEARAALETLLEGLPE